MGEHQPTAMPVLNDSERLGLERKSAGDFPLYRQDPHTPSARGWALILLGVILGLRHSPPPSTFSRPPQGALCPPSCFLSFLWPCSPWWREKGGAHCFERRRGGIVS